jgi:hypothetical protein
MRIFPLAVILSALAAFAIACSSDPAACNDKGRLSGAETCTRLKAAFDEKCSQTGLAFDCNSYLSKTQCTQTLSFCTEGVDKGAADWRSAADCQAVRDIQVRLVCFD